MSDTLLTFIHISDTHISPDPNYSLSEADYTPLEGAKELVKSLQALPFKADFILHTGDVVYDPHESAYATAKEIFAPLDIPIHYIAGNHDHNDGLQRHLMGRDASDVIPNLHYEFEVNGVQIICVDSNGPVEVPAGYVTDDQLEWLESLCTADDDRPLVIAIHHNPIAVGIPWLDNLVKITNGLAFHNIIKKAQSRLVGVFYGHIHQSTTTYYDGVMYSSASSSWRQFLSAPSMINPLPEEGARPGYSVVMVKPNQSFTRRYQFDVPSLST
jgi:3',5'-cyclic-AMP phosphodiesterase